MSEDKKEQNIAVKLEEKNPELESLNKSKKILTSLDEKKLLGNSMTWKKQQNPELKGNSSDEKIKSTSSNINRNSIRYKTKRYLARMLDNPYQMALMGLITIYALLADDIRVLSTDKDGDQHFYGTYCFLLAIFGVEILISCFAKDDYFLGFFFYLDILSTASLIFDIGWIADDLFGSSAQNAKNAAQLARASRASRVGTRAGRIIRIVRLIRLVKLYKHAQQGLLEAQENKMRIAAEKEEEAKELEREREREKEREREREREREIQREKERLKAENKKNISNDMESHGINDEESSGSKEIKEIGNKKAIAFKKGSEGSKEIVRPSGKEGGKEEELPQETKVGKKLSDLTTKRVIMLVMSIMFSIPLFSLDTYVEDYTSYESGLRTMYMWWQYGNQSQAYIISKETYISQNTNKDNSDVRNPLIYLEIQGTEIYIDPDVYYMNLRNEEKDLYTYAINDEETLALAIYDKRADTSLDAILGLVRTVFVCFVLTAGALFFSKDANDLVLQPIESMLEKVKRIAKNPLEAAQIEENEALAMEELNKKNKKDKKADESTYETTILEKTIIKIGALLALGFGEAGSEIIAQNMAKSGEVDPMIPGKKMMAIFGFCDIRNFTDATEILQEDVMVFVNEIAEIVHSIVDHFSGAANKNIGDAFLLVWKFPDKEIKQDPNNPSLLMLSDSRQVKQIADMSVISFLKIIAGINLSKKLKKYKEHKGLNERMPNYSVKMGFGLHVGWAIEGAIGSEFKIDASYLSPNVNMASRLEAATKQFGVPILISGSLYNILTPDTQKELRHIDRVTVKGSIEPVNFFTCDLDTQNLVAKVKTGAVDKFNNQKMTKTEKKKLKVYNRLKRNELKKKVMQNKTTVANLFTSDKELKSMRETYSKEFYDEFAKGLEKYLAGHWEEARDILEKTHNMLPFCKDGPSNTLLEVIKEFGGKAPSNWQGYRELTEK